MSDDDVQARKARAARLRKEIERVIEQGEQATSAPAPAEAPADENPREFIHRKMREDAAARQARTRSRERKPRG
jgi:hypothetical protein